MTDILWEIAGISDAGPKRMRNEDCIGFDESRGLMVLADGIGGRPAGDVASTLAVEEVMAYVRGRLTTAARHDAPTLRRWLDEAATAANAKIFAAGETNRARQGMGTTLVAAVLTQGEACIAHVGDSRAYLVTNGRMTALTRDHTLMGERIEIGLTHEKYFGQIKKRSNLTRAIGVNRIMQIDTQSVDMPEDAILMLASDGLFEPIPDEKIEDILKSQLPLSTIVATLVNTAIALGSDDNVSVILARPRRCP